MAIRCARPLCTLSASLISRVCILRLLQHNGRAFEQGRMSALGQKQTCAAQKAMSAYPRKADIVCDKVRIMKPVTIASVRAHGVRQLLVYCNGKREGDWPGSADRAGSGLGVLSP